MPSSDRDNALPSILAEDVWVKFMIRYHRKDMTLRETLVRIFERTRPSERTNGRGREGYWALRGVDLVVRQGEVVGLIGPNGSGKTTLLKTLAGILGPDRGRLIVRGKIGCLLSFNVGFNLTLSGRENVYLNGSILGMSQKEINERFAKIVEMSELNEFIDAPVRTYSAGMRARLGFSIAIHIDPDVLMLDEVLGVGDAAFRAKTGTILRHLRQKHKAIVIASHDLPMIRQECSRAIWLEHGRIRMDGSPEEVTQAYLESIRQPVPVPAGGSSDDR